MSTFTIPRLIGLSIMCTCFFFALSAHAADITFGVVPNSTERDTATIVEVRIDPQGEDLNAIEGTLRMDGADIANVSSVIVETGGSLVSLWPVHPEYSHTDNVIRFTGGKPEGFIEEGLLFRLRIFSKKPGIVNLSWIGGSAYLNDGAGTATGVSSRSLKITLSHGEPNIINPSSSDVTPPRFDMLEISQDADVYDGKYFVSFHARDDVSGIAHYSIVEGQVTTDVSEGIYVLHDQERRTKTIVIAYDQAGNSTSIEVPTKYEWLIKIMILSALLLIALIVIFFGRRMRFLNTV